ncbi:unnamed protein product [Brassica oleracea]
MRCLVSFYKPTCIQLPLSFLSFHNISSSISVKRINLLFTG